MPVVQFAGQTLSAVDAASYVLRSAIELRQNSETDHSMSVMINRNHSDFGDLFELVL